MAALAFAPSLSAMSQRVLAAIAVRLGFLFTAIAAAGPDLHDREAADRPRAAARRRRLRSFPLSAAGLERRICEPSIGACHRCLCGSNGDRALWPKVRPLMWTYAVIIAVSRVVLTAHFPSDVLAGAIIGVAGALLVRDWFASRRLAFAAGHAARIRATVRALIGAHEEGCPTAHRPIKLRPPVTARRGGMMSDTSTSGACRPQVSIRRSGAERGGQHCPPDRRDRRRLRQGYALRDHLRQ